MKSMYLMPIIFLVFWSCEKAKIDELPGNITKLTPVVNLADSLLAILPPGGNAMTDYPLLFADTIQKNIILIKESKIYVTFIDEGASYKNSLCWYSYKNSHPPLKSTDIIGNVLFPNISRKDEGGLLEPGYTIEVGTETFPVGTVIGFSLIANGWQAGTINYGNPTYYTDNSLNFGGEQRHILFKNAYSHYIIIGFEDLPNVRGGDFNDILFAVSDNDKGYEASSFDLSRMVVK